VTAAAQHDRYERRSILRSERMYGEGFQSPGRHDAMAWACAMLELRPGMRVLDVGSGLGGPAAYLAREHGVDVVGVDTAPAMVELAAERAARDGLAGVTFRLGDVRTLELAPASFDVVWTRDTVLYVAEKAALWARVHELLRPGGQLFVTDFCRGAGEPAPDFAEYASSCGYHLQTIAAYARTLAECGLVGVRAVDETPRFERSLRDELAGLTATREAFAEELGQEDYEHLVERWRRKIDFCARGELRWGLFLARRAA
jgi:phosphoethanolamine N-methyltransferase